MASTRKAMAGGGFHAPFFAVSWPTGAVGGMGLEGAVKLGYRNGLAGIADPVERKRTYDEAQCRRALRDRRRDRPR